MNKKTTSSSSSSSSLIKKKKSNPRNPLKDLNSIPLQIRISAESQRRGCFSFFNSNSSSKPQQRTPKSAPPPNSVNQPKKPSKNCSRNSPRERSSDSSKLKRNGRRLTSKDPILGDGLSSKGINPNPEFCLSSSSQLGKEVHLENCGLNSTPEKEKSYSGLSPELGLETNETEKNVSSTPNSNTTPPIKASISPEVVCGSNVDPVPACFAAGHMIAGVLDRRKCRPRGILAVGGECGFSDGSQISSVMPPVAEASIQWLSSPSENVFGSSTSEFNEASVNWLAASMNVGKSEIVDGEISPLRIRDSSDLGFWRFSPTNSDVSRSPKVGGLLELRSPDFDTTPSSGNGIQKTSSFGSSISPFSAMVQRATTSSCNDIRRTPSSGSSISPFSAIVQRATASSSGFRAFIPHEEKGVNRYDSVTEECTPLSGDFWSEANCASTPSSYSKPKKKGILSPIKLDSVSEFFGSMRLSPKQDASKISPPLRALSFQFGCPGTPSNSNDLNYFKKPSNELDSKDKDLRSSDLRISWRDGLVSRIFEMGDLDCCKWLSDDEENVNYWGEEKVESEIDLKNKSLVSKEENERNISDGYGYGYGYGSFEFPVTEIDLQKNEACAESISTDGGGLISSKDSDWTLFYQNRLFEVD